MNTYHVAVFMNRFLKREHLHGFAHAFLIKLPASKILPKTKGQVLWLLLADIKSENPFVLASNI